MRNNNKMTKKLSKIKENNDKFKLLYRWKTSGY